MPFVVAGVAFGRLAGVFSWVKRHFRVVNLVSGLILAAFGVLLLTNSVHYLSNFFIDLLDRVGLQRLSDIDLTGRAPYGTSGPAPGSVDAVVMAPAIRFRSAVALLGAFPALAGVDLDVARGEVVLLQGANGAGKTSLLRACAGLLPVRRARPRCSATTSSQDRRAVRRRVGLLGHASSLYDDLTVADNVRFAVRAAGGRADAVDPALERLGLDGRLPATRGRPAVGRPAPAGRARRPGRPRPRAVAARRAPRRPRRRAPRPARRAGPGRGRPAARPCVLASHELDRAVALAGRIVTMAGGQVVGAGTVAAAAAAGAPAPGSDRGPHRPALPGAGPCGVTPPSSPARTCASRPAAGWRPTRWRPSPCSCCVLFGFALDPDRGVLDPGRPRPVLGRRAVLLAAGRAAQLRDRGRRRRPGRAAPVRARPGRDLPRQGRRGRRSSWSASRSCSASASSSSTAPT